MGSWLPSLVDSLPCGYMVSHPFLDFAIFGTSMRELFQVDTINMSVAVWVGIIALIGLATDDGVIMATYLRDKFRAQDGAVGREGSSLHRRGGYQN